MQAIVLQQVKWIDNGRRGQWSVYQCPKCNQPKMRSQDGLDFDRLEYICFEEACGFTIESLEVIE